MKTRFILTAAVLVNMATFNTAFCQPSQAGLQEEISALKDQVSKLEARLDDSTASSAAAPVKTVAVGSPVKSFLDQIQVSGMLDSTYSYNFNSPTVGTNVGRVFDHDSNDFNFNAAKIVFAKPVSADSPVGFRTDLMAGEDAKLIHSAGLGDPNDSFDLEQAYAELNLGTSNVFAMNDIDLKVGKFVTLAGAEVIESKDNWNTSRSLLFGYAIPFTHTGVRGTYTFDNTWDVAIGVNNGWDVTDDNNDSKTLETHIGFNGIALPGDSSLTVALQGYFGAETADDNSSQRDVGDLVATYKTPWKPLTLLYNFDYASQEHATTDGGTADWYGHAGYFRFDLSDDWSIIGRGEYFNDEDGMRVASGTPANYREFTGTLEYRPWKGVITRVEYRNDHASRSVFNDDNSGLTNSQDTLSGELVLSF